MKKNQSIISDNIKKIIFFLYLFNSSLVFISGQNYISDNVFMLCDSNKNQIDVSVSILISKTNFEDNLIDRTHVFKDLIEQEPPNQFYFNIGYGVKYLRSISWKWAIGIGIGYRKYGQQSRSNLGLSDLNVQKLRIVGSFYEMSFPLKFQFKKKPKINLYLVGEPIFNIYNRVIAFDFRYTALLNQELGCCTSKYHQATGGFVRKIRKHVEWDYWRIGLSVGGEGLYELSPNWGVSITPTFNFYSSFLKKSLSSDIASGFIFSFNTDFAINYSF